MLYIWRAVIREGGTCERDYFTKVEILDFWFLRVDLSRSLILRFPRSGMTADALYSSFLSGNCWRLGSLGLGLS